MARARKTEDGQANVVGTPEPATTIPPVEPAVEAPTPEPSTPTEASPEVKADLPVMEDAPPVQVPAETPVEVKASAVEPEPVFKVMAAPALVTTGTVLAFTEGDAATVIDSGITATDADNTITTGYVQITTGYENGADVLAVTNANGITGAWDAATGKLTLTGSTTPANWQTLLRTVTFVTGANPSITQRVVTFMVNDGGGPITATRAISVTALPPTLSMSLLDNEVAEMGTPAQIALILDEVNGNEQDVTVPLVYTGTAVRNTDYTVSAVSVTIPSGDTIAYVYITPLNDSLIEGEKTIIVSLGSLTNATASETDFSVTITLTSEDEASVPVVNFDNPEIVGYRRNGFRGTKNDAKIANASVSAFLTTLSGAGGSMHTTNQTLQAPKQTKASAIAARNAADKTISTQVRNNYRY
jgi:hypothetical protein